MTAAKKIPAREPLNPATLDVRVERVLARHALWVVTVGPAPIGASSIETDKRSQAKTIRDLCEAGWLSSPRKSEYGVACDMTPEAILALASEPTAALPLWYGDRGDSMHGIPCPCAPVSAAGSQIGTADVRAMIWRVLHPQHYRWALVPTSRWLYQGFCTFPIPLDSAHPIAPQLSALREQWRTFAGSFPDGLDLVVSDDATVLRHQQARARALWKEHRGRTRLALARFGGFSSADAAHEASEDDVDEIPSLDFGFIRSRSEDGYSPASWEDEAQKQLVAADEAIARAQARRAALLKRYTTVAIANPGPRPYDAMRARYEEWIAAHIIEQTGVDPRTLPETDEH